MTFDPKHLNTQLNNIFTRLKGSVGEIVNLTPLSGGASAETWLFDYKNATGESEELILRTSNVNAGLGTSLEKEVEAKVQMAAFNAKVPVARVVTVLKPEDEIGSGYIMERHSGETIARKILRDDLYANARENMAAQCGETLAKLHSIPLDKLPSLESKSTEQKIIELQKLYKSFGEPVPVFDLALRWLLDNQPETSEAKLVHGDFRNGNFIVDENGIKTVLDWELAHFGDPMEDLGWLCVNSWRFGEIDKPVGGFGERENLYAAYEKVSGTSVNREDAKFWEIFGTFKWGTICLLQGFKHLSGEINSVEHAAIGRRVSETELDLLDLIYPQATIQNKAINLPSTDTIIDRPTKSELILATREFLENKVQPELKGALGFNMRVALNVLKTVERELELGEQVSLDAKARLNSLLPESKAESIKELNLELCEKLLKGEINYQDQALQEHLWATTMDKLSIDNPNYASYKNKLTQD